MPDINETIVRHFFELNGFLVRTNVKYWISGERGGGDSDIDLVVYNLSPDRLNPPEAFVLTLDELPGIRRAIVETKGWHTSSFTEGLISKTPRIFNFVRPEAIAMARDTVFLDADFLRILVVSRLSRTHDNRKAAIQLLKDGDIDHVIEFGTILRFIVNQVDANKNYPDSEILQTIRLLKVYGMLSRKEERRDVINNRASVDHQLGGRVGAAAPAAQEAGRRHHPRRQGALPAANRGHRRAD